MSRTSETTYYRELDAPRDVVYDAIIGAISARLMNARLLAANRVLGIIVLRVSTDRFSIGRRIEITVGALSRESTEMTLRPMGVRSVLDGDERALDMVLTVLDAALDAARAAPGSEAPGDAREGSVIDLADAPGRLRVVLPSASENRPDDRSSRSELDGEDPVSVARR